MNGIRLHLRRSTAAASPAPRHEARQAAWRWRYRDLQSGEEVDPSEPMTPAEVFKLNPAAELIPGSQTLLPQTMIRLWR